MKLGVNIDHIAVLREARRVNSPNLIEVLGICQIAKADQITIHLREDRRHINDQDATNIIKHSMLPVNLECSINDEMIKIAVKLNPHRITLVPENREEVTTEGGLDLEKHFDQIEKTVKILHQNNIDVSLFIDPSKDMVELSKQLNVKWIELHTGSFANIYAMLYSGLEKTPHTIKELELDRKELKHQLKNSLVSLKTASVLADKLNLKVAAGHGLNYQNISYIKEIKEIKELNIGQSIIARSIFTGLEDAILDMKKLIN